MNGNLVTKGYNSTDCSGVGMEIPMDTGTTDECLPINISGRTYGGYIRKCVGQSLSGLTGTLQSMVYPTPGCQGLPADSDSAGVGVCLFDYQLTNTTTPYIIFTANATALNLMRCSDNACVNCVPADTIPLNDLGFCVDGSDAGPMFAGLSLMRKYVPIAGSLTPVVDESPSVTAFLYKNVDECLVDKNAGLVGSHSLGASSAALDVCQGSWSSGGQFMSTKGTCMNGNLVTKGYNSTDCSGVGMEIPMGTGTTDECLPINISGTTYGGYIRKCVGQSSSGLTGTLQSMVYPTPGCQGLPADSDSAGVGVCLFDYQLTNTTTPYIIFTANATALNLMRCSDNACVNCVPADTIPLNDLGFCVDGSDAGPMFSGLSLMRKYVPIAGSLTPVVDESPSVTAFLYKNVDECLVDKK